MTPQELIEKGIEVIQRDGWHQGDLYKRAGDGIPKTICSDEFAEWAKRDREAAQTAPVCAIGSLYRAATGFAGSCYTGDASKPSIDTLITQAANLLEESLRKTVPGESAFAHVAEFNDANTTTVEDVIQIMKEAAQ